MNKQQRLRCRAKQLEHQNKAMYQKCKDFDLMQQKLMMVVNLYENRCKQDGYTEKQIEILRNMVIPRRFMENKDGE